MTQEFRAFGAEDGGNVEKERTWVRNHYDADARHHYETVERKLRLLHTIVRSGWIAPNEKWKLQSLGVTFGDALAQRMGLSWVAVEDEYGSDPALQVEGTTI